MTKKKQTRTNELGQEMCCDKKDCHMTLRTRRELDKKERLVEKALRDWLRNKNKWSQSKGENLNVYRI